MRLAPVISHSPAESPVAKRYLAAAAGEEVQGDRGNDRDVDEVEDGDEVGVEEKRQAEVDGEEAVQPETLHRARKNRGLGGVAGEEESAASLHG